MSHTINVSDLSDHDAVLRVLQDMQTHGVSYALIQDGIEVAKFVPVAERNYNNDKVSEELTKKRMVVLERMEVLSKEIGRKWSTDETALEAIQNDRR